MCTSICACLHKCGHMCTNGSHPYKAPDIPWFLQQLSRTSLESPIPSFSRGLTCRDMHTYTPTPLPPASRSLHLLSAWSDLIFAGAHTLIYTPALALVSGTTDMWVSGPWSHSSCCSRLPPNVYADRLSPRKKLESSKKRGQSALIRGRRWPDKHTY